MVNRLVSVGDDFTLPDAVKVEDTNLPARLGAGELNATYAPSGLLSAFSKGKNLTVYGHSYTPVPGFYVSDGGEWSTRLANRLGMTRQSFGASGARMIEMAARAIGTTVPGIGSGGAYPAGKDGPVVLECEMNDALFGPVTAAGRAGFTHALRAFLAAVTAGQRIDATEAVAAGTWNSYNDGIFSGGSTRWTQDSGQPLTFSNISAPGGKVYILTTANASTSEAGTIRVSVDGVDQGIAYSGQDQMQVFGGVSGGSWMDYSNAAITVAVPASGTHTIAVSKAAGDFKPIYVDALCIPGATPPAVLVCKDPPVGTLTSPENQANWAANSPALHAIIDSVTAEFSSAKVVDLGPGWDATLHAAATDSNKFHPGDAGMQHIADALEAPLMGLLIGQNAESKIPARLGEGALNATFAPAFVSASALPIWNRKRVLSQLNQSPVRVLMVGDSTTAGVYSDSYTTAIGTPNQGGPNSYPAQLAKRLTAAGIPAEHSFTLPGHPGNDDSRWNLNGQWDYTGANMGAGANASITASTAGRVATVTPGTPSDTYVVYFFGDPGTGVIDAQATGGAVTTINTAKPSGGVYSATVSAGSASAANVLTLTNAAGTVFVLGVEAYDSANPNKVRIMGAGVGGSRATDWATGTNTNLFGSLALIKAIAPDLTVISLGVNDGGAGTDAATVTAAIDIIEAAAAISGDVLQMSAVPHGGPTILDGYNAAFKANGRPYVDLQARWGYAGQTLQFLTVDNTHPNAIGYGDMATAVARHLLDA